MKFFAHICLFLISVPGGANLFATGVTENPATSDTLGSDGTFQRDTLVDLNKELKGIKEIVFPQGTVIPKALEISPKGVVILTSPDSLKADKYSFELKAISNIDEVYIVEVSVRREEGKYLVTTICDKIDMATGFRAEGKIYIVVTVSMILFVVIIAYLVWMDRKMRKINAGIQNRGSN